MSRGAHPCLVLWLCHDETTETRLAYTYMTKYDNTRACTLFSVVHPWISIFLFIIYVHVKNLLCFFTYSYVIDYLFVYTTVKWLFTMFLRYWHVYEYLSIYIFIHYLLLPRWRLTFVVHICMYCLTSLSLECFDTTYWPNPFRKSTLKRFLDGIYTSFCAGERGMSRPYN